jgi:hypothetical protein
MISLQCSSRSADLFAPVGAATWQHLLAEVASQQLLAIHRLLKAIEKTHMSCWYDGCFPGGYNQMGAGHRHGGNRDG